MATDQTPEPLTTTEVQHLRTRHAIPTDVPDHMVEEYATWYPDPDGLI